MLYGGEALGRRNNCARFFNVMFVLSVVFILRFGALKHAGLIGGCLLFELFSKIKSGLEK